MNNQEHEKRLLKFVCMFSVWKNERQSASIEPKQLITRVSSQQPKTDYQILRLTQFKSEYIKSIHLGQISAQQLAILCRGDWPNLQSLSLLMTKHGPAGLESLQYCNWNKLKYVNLDGNKIGSKGVSYLMRADIWSSLQKLYLESNQIGNEGLKLLSRCDLPSINQIDLTHNYIGADGIGYLSLLSSNSNAIHFKLNCNKIGTAGMFSLMKLYCDHQVTIEHTSTGFMQEFEYVLLKLTSPID